MCVPSPDVASYRTYRIISSDSDKVILTSICSSGIYPNYVLGLTFYFPSNCPEPSTLFLKEGAVRRTTVMPNSSSTTGSGNRNRFI